MNYRVESEKLLKILRRRELPEFKNLTEVCKFVTKFMKKQYDLKRDNDINNGYCFIWAYLVWALNEEEVKFATTDNHVVVEHNGLFYDSTNLSGCEFLEDIDLDLDETAFVDVKGMAWYWARCGTAKKEFRSVLRRTCNNLYNKIRVGGFNEIESWHLCVEDIPN